MAKSWLEAHLFSYRVTVLEARPHLDTRGFVVPRASAIPRLLGDREHRIGEARQSVSHAGYSLPFEGDTGCPA